jgi:hypothetical protein
METKCVSSAHAALSYHRPLYAVASQLFIPSQHKAVEEFLTAKAAKRAAETMLAIDALRAAMFTPTSTRESSPIVKRESLEKFCTLGWVHKLLTLPKHYIMLKMPMDNTPKGGGVVSKDSVKIIGRKIIY